MDIIPDADTAVKISEWSKHKRLNQKVVKHMRIASYQYRELRNRVFRMSDCGKKIVYEVVDNVYKFAGASLCRDRLCPICAWRLSIKRTAEMMETIRQLSIEYPDTKAIHVVLTVRNCRLTELRDVLKQITQGFTRLKKRRLWQDYIMGYLRSVEITYNAETETYHPHIHCIAIVANRYSRQISVGDWSDMWRDAARLDYNPIIWATHAYAATQPNVDIMQHVYDIEQSKTDADKQAASKAAIIEAVKYAVKPTALDAIARAGDIGEFSRAVAGTRMLSCGGIVKQLRAKLGYTIKDEPGEQMPPCIINPDDIIDRYYVVYEWCATQGHYTLSS